MKRRLVVSLVFVLALALCGGLVWFNFFRDKMIANFFANMQPPPQTISTVDVTAKTWTPGIMAIGTARAANGVELAVQTAGIVREIKFTASQRVKKGDVVVQLDDAAEQADRMTALASITLNEAAVQRAQALRARNFESQANTDQAVAALSTARASLAKAQAVIDQKALKAPFDGVIGIPRIDIGQYLQPGTVVATLQDIDNMKVDFSVPEQMIEKVKIGQPVRFGLAETDLPLTGKITGIDPRIDPQTRLVSLQATLDANPDRVVQPGGFVHVRIELPPEPNIVTVPQTAVVTSLFGDYAFIVVPDEKDAQRQTAKQVFLKVGRRSGPEVEITSGLEPGQRVVISGQNKLQPGSVVIVDNAINVGKLAASEGK